MADIPHPADTEAQIDALRAKINASTTLQSLLFDIDLLPEQIKDGDLRRWGYVQAIIGHLESMIKLLVESRKWQSEGEFGAPLGPECWTPEYADYMARLEAAIGSK